MSERDTRQPQAGVTSGCELKDMDTENHTSLSEKLLSAFNTEPSLQNYATLFICSGPIFPNI